MKVKLRDVRIAFPTLFVPKAMIGKDGKPSTPKYSITALFPPGSAPHKEISAAIKTVASEKWPTSYEVQLKALKASDKLCLHDGDTKPKYEAFPGNLFVSASSVTQPDVRDSDTKRIPASNPGRIYGGCYADVIVSVWAQDNQYGKRINAEVLGVQFRRDGDAFRVGAAATDDDYEDLSVGDDSGGGGGDDSLI